MSIVTLKKYAENLFAAHNPTHLAKSELIVGPVSFAFVEYQWGYRKDPKNGYKPTNYPRVDDLPADENNPIRLPAFRVGFLPAIGRGATSMMFLGVNQSGTTCLSDEQRASDLCPIGHHGYGGEFEVYDVELKSIPNPTFHISEIPRIDPETVMIHNGGIGDKPRVIDESQRKRINQYFDVYRQRNKPDFIDVKKFMILREVAERPEEKLALHHGDYTYNYVKRVASTKENNLFTQKDLTWLESYMNAHDIPIPRI